MSIKRQYHGVKRKPQNGRNFLQILCLIRVNIQIIWREFLKSFKKREDKAEDKHLQQKKLDVEVRVAGATELREPVTDVRLETRLYHGGPHRSW